MLAVTCHLHFWQNGWDLLLHATAVTVGRGVGVGMATENKSAQKIDPGAAPVGTQTHDLLITSLAL